MDQEVDEVPDAPDCFTSQIQSIELRRELTNLARRKGVPAHDREDIASEAITRALSNQQEYDRNRGSFSSWIMGITENVIRDYYGKLNAQKRKAEGGVITLDAASIQFGPFGPNENNRREPKDTFVERQHASEEVQHFIDTASLSEKEKMAVAFRLGKDVGGDFTSSTAHRAFQKLRQVRDDEKFREQQAGSRLLECAYGTIPTAEHNIAFLYDVLRQSGWFIDAVNRWRKSTEWKEIVIQLEEDRSPVGSH
jgi:RNA polymerase sigma factor (sigma-70 family)